MAFNGKFELNGILKGTIGSNSSLSGKLANEALRGYSAYELAVLNGFDGTEEEWLESLKSAVDLKPYSTTKENDEKYQPKGEYADKKHTHDEYLTEHQDLSGYVTKEELENIDIPTSWNDLKDKPFYEDEQGEVVPLDEKYIPTNIARKSDLDEISENSPLIDYTLTDNKQYINLWEFEKTGYYLITNNTSSDMVFIFAKTGTGKDSIATKILEMGMNIIKKGESVIAYAMHINSEYQLTFLKNAKSIKTYVNAYVPSTNTWESLVEKVITDSSFSSSNGKFLSIANGVITPVEIPSDYVTEAELKEAIANAPTGVTSWNDLTDKPFYEVESVQELYSDTLEFEFIEDMGLGACNSEIPYQVLKVDQKIKVAWNDVEYDLVLQNFEMQPGVLIAGNGSLLNDATGFTYEDTGEPFIILCNPNIEDANTDLIILTNEKENNHNIVISLVTIQINGKHIPNGIFVVNITDNGDGTCSADITGKEFMQAYYSDRTIVCKDEYSYYYFNYYGEAMDSRVWCFISIPGHHGGYSGNGNTYTIKELTFNNTFNSNEGDWYYHEMELATKEALEHAHSWNELEDKPFGEDESVQMLCLGNFGFVEMPDSGGSIYTTLIDLGEDKQLSVEQKIRVYWNWDVEYDLVLQNLEIMPGYLFAGNAFLLNAAMGTSYKDTGEPFLLIYAPAYMQLALYTNSTDKTHDLTISSLTYTPIKIDEKYIPDTIARKSDLDGISVNEEDVREAIESYMTENPVQIPSEYVTETELNNKGYLTEHQPLTDYALKSEIPTDYAKENHTHDEYLTEIPSEYVTEAELKEAMTNVPTGSGGGIDVTFNEETETIEFSYINNGNEVAY